MISICAKKPVSRQVDSCYNAGAAGIEPATCGFGDRHSTS
jgi:hypothetical protein